MTYAANTTVSVANSQQEIARTLTRYKVDTYTFGQAPGMAQVEFLLNDLPIRVGVKIPTRPANPRAKNPDTGRFYDTHKVWEQDVKQRWRALLLFIKGALEAIELSVVTPEEAFMAFLVAPDGETLGQKVIPGYLEAVAANRALEA